MTSCLTFSYLVPMHVMRKYNAKPQRICSFFCVALFLVFFLKTKKKNKTTQKNGNPLRSRHQFWVPPKSGTNVMAPPVSEKLMGFSIWRPPYWIRHFEFWKSNFRFVISDPENPQVQSIRGIDGIVDFMSAILHPPFWNSKIWYRIRNQRPQKPPYLVFLFFF